MSEPIDFLKYLNLASEKLGAKAISCSDDFFAPMENLVKSGRGVFIADKYTDRGKWMDGWESRRKRIPGHDWCIIQLGAAGRIYGLDVDTNHFLGNHPPYCSIEVCNSATNEIDKAVWKEILTKSLLHPGSQHLFEVKDEGIWTHVKLHIYPDGGIARLKVYGKVIKNWSLVDEEEEIDLSSALNGAKCIDCNDMFFSHMDNLLMPGRGINMGDGWETKRNRTPGNVDWVTIRLAHPGVIDSILVDTCHFKGNYPDACKIEACNCSSDSLENADWFTILDKSKLSADAEHVFNDLDIKNTLFTHVKLNIFPDGGISRLRLWGRIKKSHDYSRIKFI